MKVLPVIVVASTLGAASQAYALSEGCAALNGYSNQLLQVRYSTILSNTPFSAGEIVTLTADRVTALDPEGPVWAFMSSSLGDLPPQFESTELRSNVAFIREFGEGALEPFYDVLDTPISEKLVIPEAGLPNLGLTEFGPYSTDFHNIAISCGLDNQLSLTVASLSKMQGAHQQQSVRQALRHSLSGRLQQGGQNAVATRSNFFFSTQSLQHRPVDANIWLAFSGRGYFDGYEGYSAEYTTGIDWKIGETTLIGVMAGAGVTRLEDAPTTDADSAQLMLGTYGAHILPGGVQLDGYLAYAAVDYEVGGTEFDTDRVLAGISARDQRDSRYGSLELRASLTGAWEDFPTGITGVTGATASQYRASIGARHDWTTPLNGTALMPWVALDLEYGYLEDTDDQTDEFVAPRVAVGLDGSVGAGTLAASLDVGQTTSDVIDAGIDLSYRFNF